MRSTVLAVSSVGLVQGVSEMPLPDILKSIVSIIVGVSYCLDLVLKLKAKRKARNYYKTKETNKP
jgi:hypothetical protein